MKKLYANYMFLSFSKKLRKGRCRVICFDFALSFSKKLKINELERVSV